MTASEASRVYALEQAGRSVYCNSPHCVSALLKLGWKLGDSSQLSALVTELASGRAQPTHDPSDHFA